MEAAKNDNQTSDQDPIFAEYFKDWYETYKTPGTSSRTKERYKVIYNFLTQYFGKTKISKITRHKYQTFMNQYGKDHVKDAAADGIIRTDFIQRINLTWNDERNRKIDYLNFEQVQRLKKALLDGII